MEVERPVTDQVTRVRQECVARMHDTFRSAGRSGRKGEIGHAVGIAVRLAIKLRDVPGKAVWCIFLLEKWKRRKHRIEIRCLPIRAPVRLRDYGLRIQLCQEVDDLTAGEGPVERGIAGNALA